MARRAERVLRAIALLAIWATGAAAAAEEPPLEEHPGYFDLDGLGVVDPDGSSVDINLQGAMLRLVGAAVLREEPELAELVSQMRAMRVLVAPVDDLEPEKTTAAIAHGVSRLENLKWQRVVRVKEEGEQVHVYLKEVEGEIHGLTLFVFDPTDEMTLINIAGRVDVDLLGALSQAFDIPSLEAALEMAESPREGSGDQR